MRIPPPDPLTTILLYLSAIQMALNAALAPGTPIAKAHPELTMAGVWPYVPIGLLALATIVWVVRGARPPTNNQSTVTHQGGGLPVPIIQVNSPPPRQPWHAKLEGFQIYLLIYMAMFFIYQIAQLIVSHKK